MRPATRSIWAPLAPAAMATWRACRVMCPRWMPSVASARRAARFCANPTLTMISASSRAVVTCISLSAACAVGCTRVAPPTMPTAMGISSVPTSAPPSSPQVLNEV